MSFSLFENNIKNVIPSKEITLKEFLEIIKQNNPLIEKIRAEPNKKERDLLKRGLSYVTFAGTFSKRGKNNLIKSSGYACLDFDEIKNLQEAKEKLSQDKFSHCVFISPSGNGLKLIVKIPEVKNDEEYKQYWNSISKHYSLLETDEANKDISRACYLSFDSNPYFNLTSEIYTEKYIEEKTPIIQILKQPKAQSTSTNQSEFLEKLKSSISMEQILNHFNVDTAKNPTDCPFHHCSQRCLSFNSETAHCFDTDCSGDNSWNIFSFVKKVKGFNSSEAIKWLADFAGMEHEYLESKKEYLTRNKEPMGYASMGLNIKTIATKKNFTICPKCNNKFIFNERLGLFECNYCKMCGGIKKFVILMIKSQMLKEKSK